MKYLRKFETEAEKDVWLNSEEYIMPNVILIGRTVGYNLVNPALIPLYIEALEDLTVSFSTNAIQYSLNGATWNELPVSTATPKVSKGSKIYFKATGLTPSSNVGIGTFTISGKCNIGGNIMSMKHGDDYSQKVAIGNDYQFHGLFKNCTTIQRANELKLPATSLRQWCYREMFNGCQSLISAPALPATSLASWSWGCYQAMFKNCTSLVEAPKLPATAINSHCYREMFNGCKSLISAPALPATNLMDMCYDEMFANCTSLVNAPELPAKSLASKCYEKMFYGCSKLQYVKAMFTFTPSSSYTSNWLYGVAATGTFVKNAAATWDVTGVNGIPNGWTVETAQA